MAKLFKHFKSCIAVAGLVLSSFNLHAQGNTAAQQALASIYQSYDSIPFISFDVKFTYSSDTIFGKFTYDVLQGNYTMAGKKTLYRLGDIEVMQNDSFFVSVYKNENFILVADPKTNNTGSNLPLRQLMDSMVLVYAEHYDITNTNAADTGIINFEGIDSLAQFKSFSITYDTGQHLLYSIEYRFEEMQEIDSTNSKMSQKKLLIEFTNYHFDNTDEVLYNENNYIYYDDKICKPIDKYRGFRVFNSHTGFLREHVEVQEAP